MPPQIKQDLNRSGWETTDFPSVCEQCLPENPYVQMIKEDYGAECRLCTRPFSVFRWKADRTSRQKRTNICLTCARLKNCCQSCMLDLSFGLPLPVRDAALKMVAPGPQSKINREYYAQEHEKEIEEGRGAIEAYDKTDDKARELLRRLANSEPYHKRQRRLEAEDGEGADGQKALPAPGGREHTAGPIRTRDSRGATPARGGMRGGRGGRPFPSAAALPPNERDILPPTDPNIMSLFVTGVEDDLPEHHLRTFFSKFGTLRSLVCSHRSHCAFVNYAKRQDAEKAAQECQGKAVVAGCPLRVQWGKPKTLDTMEKDVRMMYAREGRQTATAAKAIAQGTAGSARAIEGAPAADDFDSLGAVAAPPGAEDEVNYASLQGD